MKNKKSHPTPQTPQNAKPIQPSLKPPLSREEETGKLAAEIEIIKFLKHLWLSRKDGVILTAEEQSELTDESIKQWALKYRLSREADISKLAEVVFKLSVYPSLSREEAMLQARTMYQEMRNLSARLGNAIANANKGLNDSH